MRAKGSTRRSRRTARILAPPIQRRAPPYFVPRCSPQPVCPVLLFQFHLKKWNFSRRHPPPKLSDSPSPAYAAQIRKPLASQQCLRPCNPAPKERENREAQEAIFARTIFRR